MRWKLLRRRLSVSAPRVIVRSHLPWPLRWLVVALMLGFSAALALWAFEFGKAIAGVDRGDAASVQALRDELATLREQHAAVRAIANSADTVLKAERATQERLAEQVKALEQRNAELTADLAFFERLLPAGDKAWSVRGLQVVPEGPGKLRYQLLVMRQEGGRAAVARPRYALELVGVQQGRVWNRTGGPGGAGVLEGRPYQRLEGQLALPPGVVVRQLTVRLYDADGAVLVSETRTL